MARFVTFSDGRNGLAINVDHVKYVTAHLADRSIFTFDNDKALTIMEPFDRVIEKLNGAADPRPSADMRLSA
jgi:hypothetical protein